MFLELPLKLLSVLGVLVAACCLTAATLAYPGGFDWNRDYISTLLRGPAGPSRTLADVGVLFFCVSLGGVFWRLARVFDIAKSSQFVKIGGVGSMVYAALTITPMHDLMVTISLVFLVVAVLALLRALQADGEVVFFTIGCLCLLILIASAMVYYTGVFVSVLPWAQRASFGLLTVLLLCLDWAFPRTSPSES